MVAKLELWLDEVQVYPASPGGWTIGPAKNTHCRIPNGTKNTPRTRVECSTYTPGEAIVG